MGCTWGTLQTASLSRSPAMEWTLRALRGSRVDTELLGQYFQEAAPLLPWGACPSPKKTADPPLELGIVGAGGWQRIAREGNDTH